VGAAKGSVTNAKSTCPSVAVRDEHCCTFLDLAPEPLLLARGKPWRLAEANQACRQLFLFEPDGPLPPDIVLADLFANGEAGLQNLLDRLEKKDLVLGHEAELRDRFGLTFPATLSARLITDQDQPYLLAGVRDVSEVKRTEARTRFFWSMAESSIDAIIAWSAGQGIIYANPSSHVLFRLGAHELLGRPVQELLENPAAAEMLLDDEAQGGDWHGELSLRRADGSTFDAYVSTWKQPDDAAGMPVTVCFMRDVTEQKQAAKALRESEERHRTVTEFSSDWVYWRAPDGTLLYITPACTEITGYTPEELQASPELFDAMVHADDHFLWQAHQHLESSAEASPQRLEFRIVTKNGETRWLSHVCRHVHDEAGRFLGIRASNRDVTERKRAEAALRESEEQYRHVVEQANDGICIVQDGRLKYANRWLAGILGRTVAELVGTSFIDHVCPDERPKVTEHTTRHESGEEWRQRYETTMVHRDGRAIAVELNVGPITYEGRRASLGFVRDITEMKRMTAELERHTHDLETLMAERTHEVHFLSRIITSTVTAWVIADTAGHLVRWNRAFEDLVGYPLEDLVTMRWSDLTPDEQHETDRTLVEAALAGGGHQVIEQEIRRGGGDQLPVEVRLDALDVGEPERVIFRIVTDITARKETESRLIEARHNAEEANRHKSEFLASISHELRTPLTGILGLANTLVELRKRGQDEQTSEFLSRIIKSSRQLQNLINEVLEISRIEAGRTTLTIEAIDPAELFQALENQFFTVFEECRLQADFAVAPASPPVRADKTRLTQILVNLLTNATKFTEPGGRVSVSAEPADGDTLIKFCVRDTGRGIPPDKLEKIFERFEQLDRSGTRLGVGLGLAISRQLVEAQGGHIWAESELGTGSRFFFTLPACTNTFANESASPQASEAQ